MHLFLLAPVLVVLWAAQSVVGQEKKWYCGDYECPLFTSESRGSYSLRSYGSTNWLSTSVTSSDTDANRRQKMTMFWKMFPYFNGRNLEGVKVQMAVPSLTKVVKRQDGKYDITMMFYVAKTNPPTPTTPSVSLVTRPAGQVYVHEFPMRTMPSKSVVASKATTLKESIPDSSTFEEGTFYSVAYNYPFNMKLKQYEVWMDKSA